MRTTKIAWWSAGITSAVACKIALEIYKDTTLYYIETGAAHPDNSRFKNDCENWYQQEIITITNSKGYKNPIDVALKERFINSPFGAKCSEVLKKQVRYELQSKFALNLFNDITISNQIFGFEWNRKEVNRAIRFLQQYSEAKALFPLIERKINKNNTAAIIKKAGIELPVMYKLGFTNNNCIGCVKGGKAYWNLTRIHFPETFQQWATVEREINHTCIKGIFLDQLKPTQGRKAKIIMPECGTFCDIELADVPVKNLDDVLSGRISIYEAA